MEIAEFQRRFRRAVREPGGHFLLLDCTVRMAVLALALAVGGGRPCRGR